MTAPSDPFSQGQPPAEGSSPYGSPPPGYGAPLTGDDAPPPGYGAAPPAYGTAPPAYGTPPPGYGAAYGQVPQYGPPYGQAPGYGPPSPFGQPGGPQLAGWGSRVGAFLVDSLVFLAVYLPGLVLAGVLGSASEALGGLMTVLAIVAAFAVLLWQLAVQGRTGQTIGKRALSIRLLREQDGTPVGVGLSIGRYFLHVVDQLPCYLGYLWPLWDDKKQTFADKIVKTVVIKA